MEILVKNKLAFQVTLSNAFDTAVDKVTAALKIQEFGVLTRIDVKSTLQTRRNHSRAISADVK
jgi:uncharacterized protein (DUF302 family)